MEKSVPGFSWATKHSSSLFSHGCIQDLSSHTPLCLRFLLQSVWIGKEFSLLSVFWSQQSCQPPVLAFCFPKCWRDWLGCIPEINLLPGELNQRRAHEAFFRFQHPKWYSYVWHQCFLNVRGELYFFWSLRIKDKEDETRRAGKKQERSNEGGKGVRSLHLEIVGNKSYSNPETPWTTKGASL